MAVYVGTREYKFGLLKLSHMIADNLEELHEMAGKLGVTKYFQDDGKHKHYDISKTNKKKAIELGAILLNELELIKILNKHERKM